MHFLTPAQVDVLGDVITPRYRALIYTAAYSGLRARELAALTLARVNLLRGIFEVTESLSEVRGKLVVGPTKTGRARTVRLPRFLVEILAAHLATYPFDVVPVHRRGGRPGPAPQLLPATLPARSLENGVTRGPTAPRPRHTAAAILIAEGWSMEQVKRHLGHSTIRVTSDRYGHLFEGHDEALLERLDEHFREGHVSPSCHVVARQPAAGGVQTG